MHTDILYYVLKPFSKKKVYTSLVKRTGISLIATKSQLQDVSPKDLTRIKFVRREL